MRLVTWMRAVTPPSKFMNQISLSLIGIFFGKYYVVAAYLAYKQDSLRYDTGARALDFTTPLRMFMWTSGYDSVSLPELLTHRQDVCTP